MNTSTLTNKEKYIAATAIIKATEMAYGKYIAHLEANEILVEDPEVVKAFLLGGGMAKVMELAKNIFDTLAPRQFDFCSKIDFNKFWLSMYEARMGQN